MIIVIYICLKSYNNCYILISYFLYTNFAYRLQDGKVNATDIKVTQTHLVESVKSTRPSLSIAEKLKYAKM